MVVDGYRTILADPPWPLGLSGARQRTKGGHGEALAYPTMSVAAIAGLPLADLAADGAHLWLWTTNQFLRAGFDVMEAWGFRYLAPITWVKPSGVGNYFVHRTQTLLFGYRGRCLFPLERFAPTVVFAAARRHSAKPAQSYDLIERVSPGPRLELFARRHRLGWTAVGDELSGEPIEESLRRLAVPSCDLVDVGA